MNIIYALIPLGLILLVAAVYAFFWAVKSGQFDDLDSPAWAVVLDDDTRPPGATDDNTVNSEEKKPAG